LLAAGARGISVEDTAPCPAGDVVLGGGGEVSTEGGDVGALESSYPSPGGWVAVAVTTAGEEGGKISVKAHAICGSR
jgi:hypothetical protein